VIDLHTLALFLLAVLTLFLSPGPNMAFVLSHGIALGTRAGLAAALGITVADLVLTVLTVTGFAAAVAAWPASFELLRYMGVIYLLWLAAQAVRTRGMVLAAKQEQVPMWRIFRMAMLNCLLNPKALIFFLVFLPQFVDPTRGNIPAQLAILGLTLSLVALGFNAVLGTFSGRIGAFLNRSPQAARYQGWVLAAVLLALALRLLAMDRPLAR
jgi:threonine/homoserine/homoserine lactone efflux protein